jgi:hypothetical protein
MQFVDCVPRYRRQNSLIGDLPTEFRLHQQLTLGGLEDGSKIRPLCESTHQTLWFSPPDLTTSDRTFWHADDQDSQQH